MAAGSAIVIAGPAVAAAGVGYGVYRLARALRNDDDEARSQPSGSPDLTPADEGLSMPPLELIEFRDIDARSGRVVRFSSGDGEPDSGAALAVQGQAADEPADPTEPD